MASKHDYYYEKTKLFILEHIKRNKVGFFNNIKISIPPPKGNASHIGQTILNRYLKRMIEEELIEKVSRNSRDGYKLGKKYTKYGFDQISYFKDFIHDTDVFTKQINGQSNVYSIYGIPDESKLTKYENNTLNLLLSNINDAFNNLRQLNLFIHIRKMVDEAIIPKYLFPNGVTFDKLNEIIDEITEFEKTGKFLDYAKNYDRDFIQKVRSNKWFYQLIFWLEMKSGKKMDISRINSYLEIALLSTIEISKTQKFCEFRDNFISSILSDISRYNDFDIGEKYYYDSILVHLPVYTNKFRIEFLHNTKDIIMYKIIEKFWGGFYNYIEKYRFENNEDFIQYFKNKNDRDFLISVIQESKNVDKDKENLKNNDIGLMITYLFWRRNHIFPNIVYENEIDKYYKKYDLIQQIYNRDMTSEEIKDILKNIQLPKDYRGDFFRILFNTELSVYEFLLCDIEDYNREKKEIFIDFKSKACLYKFDCIAQTPYTYDKLYNTPPKRVKLDGETMKMIDNLIKLCGKDRKSIFFDPDEYGSCWDAGLIYLFVNNILYADLLRQVDLDLELIRDYEWLRNIYKKNKQLFNLCDEIFGDLLAS